MKRTVYIPVEIEGNDDCPITDSEAITIANSIVEQCRDGFFSEDNVYDAASETLGEYGMIDFGYKIKNAVSEIKNN